MRQQKLFPTAQTTRYSKSSPLSSRRQFSTATVRLRSSVAPVIQEMCGATTTLSSSNSGFPACAGSSVRTSRPAAAIWPGFERHDQRRLVDQAAARGIDQDRARLHARERRAIDHPRGLVGERHVQRDDVGGRQQFLERQEAEFDAGPCRHIGIDDVGAHRLEPGREQRRDGAEADQADAAAANFAQPLHQVRLDHPALAGAGAAVEMQDAGASSPASAAAPSRRPPGCWCPACCTPRCRARARRRDRWC